MTPSRFLDTNLFMSPGGVLPAERPHPFPGERTLFQPNRSCNLPSCNPPPPVYPGGNVTDGILFEDFERKLADPAQAFQAFCRKNKPRAVQMLKNAGQEAS
eukprot:1371089-Amorphochlora_amoeboformis.AAC.2